MEWVAAIVAIVGLVVTLASTGYSLYQQSQQAAAQNKYQKDLAEARDKEIEENYALSIRSANEQYRQLQARQQQEADAAAQKMQQGTIEGARARSLALTAAGEAGVSGLSVNALLNDFMAQESKQREAIKANLAGSTDQLRSEMEGVQAAAAGRVASIPRYAKQPVDSPNYFGGAMRVGGSALDAYTKYTSGLNNTKTPTGYDQASITAQSYNYM
jgi:hypothetical protein